MEQIDLIRRNTIGDILRKNARRYADKTAVTYYLDGGKKSLTYKELNDAANRFANSLAEFGINKGDVAALMSHNCMQFIVAAWGFIKAGVTATYINVNFVPHEVAYQINHSDAKILFTEDSLLDIVLKVKNELKGIERFGYINIKNEPVPDGWLNLEELYSDKYSSEEPKVDIANDDIALRMYTSGTTAFPKGIDLTYSNVEYKAHCVAGSTGNGMEVDSVVGFFIPLYHGGLLMMYGCHAIGAHFVVGTLSNLPNTLNIIEKEKVSWTLFPVTIFNRLVNSPDAKDKLSSLKEAEWFGGAMPLDVLQKVLEMLPNLTLIPQWSQTECLIGTLTRLNKNTPLPKAGNIIGKPYLDTEIKIVDEDDNEVPDGEFGEIVLRSPVVMKRYYKNEEATKNAFRNGWHHTGDMAYKGDDGFYYFVDRVKDMIKTGGVNVSAVEVEQVLNNIDGIEMSAVFGVYHPDWAEAVVAAVVSKNENLTEKNVISICKNQLANFKVPKRVIFVNSIPLSHVGKILRKNLRETYKDLFE
ncbi:MAG: Long-chain-fatty-acid--CoA ligase [Smithella sp. PtaU1.Bin162]|nr:MAG: Long-chain-fatty-acid--CoA ligase [Smithella sp. PtaU1.Bin162]